MIRRRRRHGDAGQGRGGHRDGEDGPGYQWTPRITITPSRWSRSPAAPAAGATPRPKQIVVDTRGPANARLRTLVHETIHALGVDCQSYPRAHAEVIVDTLVVLGGLGLDLSGEIIPYVAGWGEDGGLDAVTEFAQLIDDLARRVETALSTAGDNQQTAAIG